MDMETIKCKRYVRAYDPTDKVMMIGYRPIQWSINPDGPTDYQLVEFIKTEKGWIETVLLEGKVIWAISLDTIPMSVKDKEQQHVDNLLSQGYTFLNEVQVNAKTKAVVPVGIASNGEQASEYSLNWLLSSPVSATEHALLRGFITGVFVDGASKLGFEVVREEGSQSLMPDVLMRTSTGYELRVKSGASENTICPTILEGAGILTSADGHIPLLMLLYLQRRFEQEFFKDDEKRLVKLCDEEGELFVYDGFDSLEGIILAFGWNYDVVRKAAEGLSLVAERFQLENIECETENFYF